MSRRHYCKTMHGILRLKRTVNGHGRKLGSLFHEREYRVILYLHVIPFLYNKDFLQPPKSHPLCPSGSVSPKTFSIFSPEGLLRKGRCRN